jgi:hypothetical protein
MALCVHTSEGMLNQIHDGCPRGELQLTYMAKITLTTEFMLAVGHLTCDCGTQPSWGLNPGFGSQGPQGLSGG